MADHERVAELAKMLMELRMATSQAEAEARAKLIIHSTDGGGPSLAAMHATPGEKAFDARPPGQAGGAEEATADTDAQAEEAENVPAAQEADHAPLARKEQDSPRGQEDDRSDLPVDVSEVQPRQTARMISAVDSARAELMAAVGQAPAPGQSTSFRSGVRASDTAPAQRLDDLAAAQEELQDISEQETKEALNAEELAHELTDLHSELANSRKEVEMLRTKLAKTEDALQKAQALALTGERELSAPEHTPPHPSHEKPRGTNPPVDLARIFKK